MPISVCVTINGLHFQEDVYGNSHSGKYKIRLLKVT